LDLRRECHYPLFVLFIYLVFSGDLFAFLMYPHFFLTKLQIFDNNPEIQHNANLGQRIENNQNSDKESRHFSQILCLGGVGDTSVGGLDENGWVYVLVATTNNMRINLW